MAYIINRFSGQQLVVLEDGTIDTSTSIGLLGRNYTGYGETQNENFVFLLENFSNTEPPSRPLSGQLWYDTSSESLNVYNGTAWASVGSAVVGLAEPEGFDGGFWYKSDTNQLFVFDSGFWKLIGPEAVAGFDITKWSGRDILDTSNVRHAILELIIDGVTLAVASSATFTINDSNPISGFSNLIPGITLSSNKPLVGNVIGNASSASRLEPGRTINGVFFDGQTDVTLKSSTTHPLINGTYLLGSNFDGSATTTWSVDATSANIIGKVVARDSGGNFSAGTITADLIGNVAGNVTVATGTSTFDRIEANEFVGATLSGNAFSASTLSPGRTINGVLFNGAENVTVPVSALNVTGTKLATNVIESSLTNLGTLNGLDIGSSFSLTMGGPENTAPLRVYLDAGTIPTVVGNTGKLDFVLADNTQINNITNISFINSGFSLAEGGPNAPALIPSRTEITNLGISTKKWNTVYANLFNGTASAARYADLAENYVADKAYEAGTVLEFGGEFEVTLASAETPALAGVVSTDPAYLMNSECKGEHTVALALQGRVPCKVIGPVKKGNMLTSAGNGFAKVANNPQIGTIIGKALEDFNGGLGVIEVAVGRI
jgi:hypothetical protein